jgi:hypothetical protein
MWLNSKIVNKLKYLKLKICFICRVMLYRKRQNTRTIQIPEPFALRNNRVPVIEWVPWPENQTECHGTHRITRPDVNFTKLYHSIIFITFLCLKHSRLVTICNPDPFSHGWPSCFLPFKIWTNGPVFRPWYDYSTLGHFLMTWLPD